MFISGLMILFLLFTFQAVKAFGKDFHVIEVRKNLQLKEGDPILHDYYLNAGSQQGLKVGMVVKIIRKIPVHDQYQNQAQDDLILPVAKLKIIHTEPNISVARVQAYVAGDRTPILDYRSVMMGDRIDILSATMDNHADVERSTQSDISKDTSKAEVQQIAVEADLVYN